jgi:hypothetical protein
MNDQEDHNATRTVARSTAAASHDSNVLPAGAGCRLNEYVIESALAHGGFGIVYLDLQSRVAQFRQRVKGRGMYYELVQKQLSAA